MIFYSQVQHQNNHHSYHPTKTIYQLNLLKIHHLNQTMLWYDHFTSIIIVIKLLYKVPIQNLSKHHKTFIEFIEYNEKTNSFETNSMGPWCNGTQCGIRVLRPGFNFQRVQNTTWCWPWPSQLYHSLGGLLLD